MAYFVVPNASRGLGLEGQSCSCSNFLASIVGLSGADHELTDPRPCLARKHRCLRCKAADCDQAYCKPDMRLSKGCEPV